MLLSGNLVWSFGVVLNISANPTLYLHLGQVATGLRKSEEKLLGCMILIESD
jgi:hypothetical protein